MNPILIILAVVFIISGLIISIKINFMCDAIRKLETIKANINELRNIHDKIDRAYCQVDIYGYREYYSNNKMFTMILNKLNCKVEPSHDDCKLVIRNK